MITELQIASFSRKHPGRINHFDAQPSFPIPLHNSIQNKWHSCGIFKAGWLNIFCWRLHFPSLYIFNWIHDTIDTRVKGRSLHVWTMSTHLLGIYLWHTSPSAITYTACTINVNIILYEEGVSSWNHHHHQHHHHHHHLKRLVLNQKRWQDGRYSHESTPNEFNGNGFIVSPPSSSPSPYFMRYPTIN